jgi:uncharacterized protein (DUF3820 family)
MTLDMDALSADVLAAAALPMPFGKFKGTRLIDLPEPYVVWFKQQGFPNGQLGRQMAVIYEIKANGLEKLIRPLLENSSAPGADGADGGNSPES